MNLNPLPVEVSCFTLADFLRQLTVPTVGIVFSSQLSASSSELRSHQVAELYSTILERFGDN